MSCAIIGRTQLAHELLHINLIIAISSFHCIVVSTHTLFSFRWSLDSMFSFCLCEFCLIDKSPHNDRITFSSLTKWTPNLYTTLWPNQEHSLYRRVFHRSLLTENELFDWIHVKSLFAFFSSTVKFFILFTTSFRLRFCCCLAFLWPSHLTHFQHWNVETL